MFPLILPVCISRDGLRRFYGTDFGHSVVDRRAIRGYRPFVFSGMDPGVFTV